MKVAGLFAGVGGIELGLSRAGHDTGLLCEIDPGARAVLATHFPEVPCVEDVCAINALPPGTELVAAGFPCQDLSQAGKTAGLEGARSGLIGQVFRLLEGAPVPWLLLENVPFMLQIAGGQALEIIVSKLEDLGYRWAYRVIDSRSFGLPQRRRRVYLVASLTGDPRTVLFAEDSGEPEPPSKEQWRETACGFYWTEGTRGLGWAQDAIPTLKGGSSLGIPSAPAIVRMDGSIVKPDIRDAERLQGFDPDWTRPAEEVQRPSLRWRLVGNAVTVDAAEWLGRQFLRRTPYDDSRDQPLRRTKSWPTAAWGADGARCVAPVSEWPVREPSASLEEFLAFPATSLSYRATRGFYSRATSDKCSLRFPPGFLGVVRTHLDSVTPT